MRLFRAGRKNWMDAQPKRMVSAGVLLENQTGQLLVVKAGYRDYWTIPGGIVEQNETPRQAAAREALEEVGLALDPNSLDFVSAANRASTQAHTLQFVFSTTLPVTEIALQAGEIEAFEFVSKAQVKSVDRRYARAVHDWAAGIEGYIEQAFDRDREGLE